MGWLDPPQTTMPGPPNVGTCPGSPSNVTMTSGTAPSSPADLAPRWAPSLGNDTSLRHSFPGGLPSSTFRQGPPNTTLNLSAPQSVLKLGPLNNSMPQSNPSLSTSSTGSSTKSSRGGEGAKSFLEKGGAAREMKTYEMTIMVGFIIMVIILCV